MRKNRLTGALVIIISICIFVLCGVGVYAAQAVEKDDITSCALKKDLSAVEVRCAFTDEFVKAHKGETLYLFELLPYQSASKINGYIPAAEAKCSASVTFKVPFDRENPVQLFAKYAAAAKDSEGAYTLCTGARFIENADSPASYTYAYPDPVSSGMPLKKGLRLDMYTDAQELGISQTVIDVVVNELLSGDGGENTVSYVWDNKTYFVDSLKLAKLDQRIRVMTDAGVNVYLDIILTAFENNPSEKLKSLYYTDAFASSEYFGFNVSNEDCVLYLEGLLRFLAQRYTDPAGENGFAGSFIMGYKVNSNRYYNNMGTMKQDDFLNSYVTAFRIADTALRSVYSGGRTYISIDNNYNAATSSEGITPDNLLDYTAKSFLDSFNTKISFAGNIPWRLAANVSPSSSAVSTVWSDEGASDTDDTQFITIKNLSVLTSALASEAYLYNGEARRMLLLDFAVTGTPAMAGEETSVDSTLFQSASWAYAYYKAYACPTVDAVIYGSHVDGADVKKGLWTSSTADGVTTPESKKPIYNIFKYIDTSRASELTASSLSRIGITSWADVAPGYDSSALAVRAQIETIPILSTDMGRNFGEVSIFNFSDGTLHGFSPSDNVDYIELRADTDGKSALYATLSHYYQTEYMGVTAASDPDGAVISLKGMKYLTLNVRVDAPAETTGASLMLRILGEGGAELQKAVYEGIATVNTGEWTTVTFKIDEYTALHDTADAIKLWVRSSDGSDSGSGWGLWVSSITGYKKVMPTILKLLIGVVVALLALVIAFFIFVAIRNIQYQKKKKKRREEMARRRAEELKRRRALARTSQIPIVPGAEHPNNGTNQNPRR